MKPKTVMAMTAVVVYIVCPAYRYWMLGSWIGYKMLADKGRPVRPVPKGSRAYKRLKGVM